MKAEKGSGLLYTAKKYGLKLIYVFTAAVVFAVLVVPFRFAREHALSWVKKRFTYGRGWRVTVNYLALTSLLIPIIFASWAVAELYPRLYMTFGWQVEFLIPVIAVVAEGMIVKVHEYFFPREH